MNVSGETPEALEERHVLLVDDHRVLAESMASVLREHFGKVTCVASAAGMMEVLLAAPGVSVVVCDLELPVVDGIEALHAARKAGLTVPFLFLTAHDEPFLARRALEFGASGYVLKSTPLATLLDAVRIVLSGGRYIDPAIKASALAVGREAGTHLSGAQLLVIAEMEQGRTAKEIAQNLGLSVRTIEATKRILMQRFDAHTSVELIYKLKQMGMPKFASWRIKKPRH
ncbi:response regulator transcription factor [Dyella sp. C11]|uniref:response regulator transcription factor n=1 Tax=Dyella sp. C11 TaxID=2126991 RepID=UPI001300B2C9|nr:response regulator transcription factor [Dyella sp. C11]